MQTLSATLRFTSNLPQKFVNAVSEHGRRSQSNAITVFDIERADLTLIEAAIVESDLKLEGLPSFVDTRKHQWDKPAEIVGLVLSAIEGVRSANDPSEFVMSFPSPCRGVVDSNATLVIPRDFGECDALMVDDEMILSLEIAGKLNLSRLMFGSVSVVGSRKSRWTRIDNAPECSVLHPHCARPKVNCAMCGVETTPELGVFFAKEGCQSIADIQFDELAFGHRGVRRKLLLPVDCVTKVSSAIERHHLRIQPIFAFSSETVRTVLGVLSAFGLLDDPIPRLTD